MVEIVIYLTFIITLLHMSFIQNSIILELHSQEAKVSATVSIYIEIRNKHVPHGD